VPLLDSFLVRDLIVKLDCPALVVAPNQLGTINHTLLTIECMYSVNIEVLAIVMVEPKRANFVSKKNSQFFLEFFDFSPFSRMVSFPHLGVRSLEGVPAKRTEKKIKIPLARLSEFANVRPFF